MLNPVANLEFWANLKPDALAYADDEIQITFSELNLFVRKIAAFLISQGVKKGNIVGTNLPSYLSFVFGYAIQSIGATLVPGVSPEKSKRDNHTRFLGFYERV
jgi:non-ribosomal peptide synthetase component E (peptide arylation enzyme)